ncbi:MAG TPA: VOC family protein [Phycisphaerales bacterium]|nr:VOC family protein [Phycisphaerales bacterium]
MKIEHVALNVAEPVAMAKWYVEHLGLRVVRAGGTPAFARFLADDSGQAVLEIYHNPSAVVPHYAALPPASLHLALASADVPADRHRLIAAGGTAEGGIDVAENGDTFAIVRDPWGVPLQLVRRKTPL